MALMILNRARISLEWSGKFVVGLEQCWWSWRMSWLFGVIWETLTGPG